MVGSSHFIHEYRVEFPTHITDHGRMNMLVTWIVDNPQASQEEDARARREEVSV